MTKNKSNDDFDKAEAPEEPETVTEDEDSTTESNAGDDATQGTVASHDVTGTAPDRHLEGDSTVDTNAGR